ncbi:MAG: hypothetical protein ACREK5_08205 [Gemmatimonadota bacterium]
MTAEYIDHAVYPDASPPPDELTTPAEKADYVHRVCAAWDFGVVPEPETFALLRGWRPIFDRYPVALSPAYHAFRALFGWPGVERGRILTTHAERLDLSEGRPEDPCRGLI